jgi:TRAP-type mannitol/chloroaromatic compound transport system substrate-binding protein
MKAFKKSTEEIINEIVGRDERFAKIYRSYSDYKNTVEQWTKISEYALLKDRYE